MVANKYAIYNLLRNLTQNPSIGNQLLSLEF